MTTVRRPRLMLVAASALVSLAAGVLTAAPALAARTHAVAVYYVGDTGTRAALYREWRGLPVTTTPIRQAVNAMLHLAPRDPDYRSLWPTATKIRGISVRSGTAKVDLTKEALQGTAGSDFACASLQQLVYTVTAASRGTVSRVQLLVEGRADGVVSEFWGAGCGADKPMARRAAAEILAPVQISYPGHNRTVGRTFTIRGEATVFEATVSWSLVDVRSGRVVRKGFVTASAGAPARGTWSAAVSLPSYYSGRRMEIRAWESSARDGSVTNLDDKRVWIA
jgi:hypothetical protein